MAMAGRIEGENDQMLMVMVTILCTYAVSGEHQERREAEMSAREIGNTSGEKGVLLEISRA